MFDVFFFRITNVTKHVGLIVTDSAFDVTGIDIHLSPSWEQPCLAISVDQHLSKAEAMT